jgi:hypothetical protein
MRFFHPLGGMFMKRLCIILWFAPLCAADKEKPRAPDAYSMETSFNLIHARVKQLLELGVGIVEADVIARETERARIAKLQEMMKESRDNKKGE